MLALEAREGCESVSYEIVLQEGKVGATYKGHVLDAGRVASFKLYNAVCCLQRKTLSGH